MPEVAGISMRSAALLVTLAALSLSGISTVACAGRAGCRSTCSALFAGWIRRRVPPATTSTFSGGRTVRLVTVIPDPSSGAGAEGGLGTRPFVWRRTFLWVVVAGRVMTRGTDFDGAVLAAGTVSA